VLACDFEGEVFLNKISNKKKKRLGYPFFKRKMFILLKFLFSKVIFK
jgi:hypothetical protein